MKFMSFNIQYGVGLDGICDPGRIANAIAGADIVALQEVSRNLPKNGHADLPAILAERLPEFFSSFGPSVDTEAGSEIVDGKAVMRRLQFGNMIFSRYPILAIRNLLLPRTRSYDQLNIQRSALEALIAAPSGPIRVYSVHLDHRGPDERISQIEFIKARATLYGIEGGAVTGGGDLGFPDLPHTDDYVLMGDFNMVPESPEYIAMTGRNDIYYGRTARATEPVDSLDRLGKRAADSFTWEEPARSAIRQYLDYCFVSGSMIKRLRDGGVDEQCIASDHKPVWLEVD